MTFWPVGIDEEWHERLKQRLMDRVRLRLRAAYAEAEGGGMMATDPPAPDLGAIRARRLALTADMLERQGKAVMAADLRTLLAAYDAQAREIERLRAEVERLRDGA